MSEPFHFDPVTHTYTLGERVLPSVTQIIKSALGDPFGGIPQHVLERKRSLGQAVHRAIELDDVGLLDEATVHPDAVPYLEAWRAFRRESGFGEILPSELSLCSRVYGYGGTIDKFGSFGKRRSLALVDVKTGLPGIMAALQTAAYERMLTENLTLGPAERYAVRCMPNGRYQVEPYTSPMDWPDFLACLRVHNLKGET